MDLATIILTGAALSMDAFAISLSRGMCAKERRVWLAIKAALFFGVAQAVMPVIGFYTGRSFSNYIGKFDHWIVMAILGLIGLKMIIESIRGTAEKPESACSTESGEKRGAGTESLNKGKKSDNMLLLAMAVATSIDALAAGVGFSVLVDSVFHAAVIIGAVTFAICLAGVLLGRKAGSLIGGKAGILGGLVLIGIGIKIFVEHIAV